MFKLSVFASEMTYHLGTKIIQSLTYHELAGVNHLYDKIINTHIHAIEMAMAERLSGWPGE